jgi:hypothetical protein
MKNLLPRWLLACAFTFGAVAMTAEPGKLPAPEAAASENAAPEKMDLFLFIGQSNMAARAPIAETDEGKLPDVFLLNLNNEWEAATFAVLPENAKLGVQGYNRFSALEVPQKKNGFSSAHAFVLTLRANGGTAPLGLIHNAIGGTNIRQWLPGAKDGFFTSTVERTKIALQRGTLKAIFWHQGESDANDPDYLVKLQKFVAALREALGVEAATVPFIVGQLLPLPKYQAFNELLPRVAEFVPHSACVRNDDFQEIGDKTHLDTRSQKLLGARYAAAYAELSAP